MTKSTTLPPMHPASAMDFLPAEQLREVQFMRLSAMVQRAYDRVKDGPTPEDIAAAQARVNAAQATLNLARIIAPFDGIVTDAKPLSGAQVTTGTVAFRLDDLSNLLVDVEISEVDVNSVAVGQSVLP